MLTFLWTKVEIPSGEEIVHFPVCVYQDGNEAGIIQRALNPHHITSPEC